MPTFMFQAIIEADQASKLGLPAERHGLVLTDADSKRTHTTTDEHVITQIEKFAAGSTTILMLDTAVFAHHEGWLVSPVDLAELAASDE